MRQTKAWSRSLREQGDRCLNAAHEKNDAVGAAYAVRAAGNIARACATGSAPKTWPWTAAAIAERIREDDAEAAEVFTTLQERMRRTTDVGWNRSHKLCEWVADRSRVRKAAEAKLANKRPPVDVLEDLMLHALSCGLSRPTGPARQTANTAN